VADVSGVKDVTVSLPHLVSAEGIISTFPMILDDDEAAKLQASAQVVREAIESLDAAMSAG
jgi:L-lactate dehydrogenase